MGCLNVNIAKLSGDMNATLTPEMMIDVQWTAECGGLCVEAQPQDLCDVNFSRIRKPFSANFGLVCSVGQGAWEYLMCSDRGFLRTYDKGYILVRKR